MLSIDRGRKIALTIGILTFSFAIVSVLAYINTLHQIDEVYVAKRDIYEGTRIDRDSFGKYIGIAKVPSNIRRSLSLLPAGLASQKAILKNRLKISRYKGDFITSSSLRTSFNDSIRHIIADMSADAPGKQVLVPIYIDLSSQDQEFTKDLKLGDRVQMWFIKNESSSGTRKVKLFLRYNGVPVIKMKRAGDLVSSIVVAMPSDLAKKYEIEKRISQELKIVFNPSNYHYLKDGELDKISSQDVNEEYIKGQVYDLKDQVKIDKLQEGEK